MNTNDARQAVRECIGKIRPDLDMVIVEDDTALLEQRIITSFQVLDMILHLEHVSGHPIRRQQLQAGSFRDIATIARVFLQDEPL